MKRIIPLILTLLLIPAFSYGEVRLLSGSAVKDSRAIREAPGHFLSTGGDDHVFYAPFLASLVPTRAVDGTPTFTRATVATVFDHEGLMKTVKSGEARFTGARRVENLVVTKSEDFSNAAWTKVNTATVTGSTVLNLPALYDYVEMSISRTVNVGSVYKGTVTLSGSGTCDLQLIRNGAGTLESSTVTITLTSTPTRYTVAHTFANVQTGVIFQIGRVTTGNATTVTANYAQVEDVTGQTNQNPSEYVSVGVLSAPFHGAGADGVKFFEYENGNTVASNVVTEAQGAAIPAATLKGYYAEGARTNLALQSQVAGTTWTATNITVGSNTAVAPDGNTTADTLTATLDNGTLTQATTGTAAAYTFSAYIKRKTGTGAVSLSADNTTFTACTINASTWVLCQDTRTLTAAAYTQSIKLATNTDEVYVWQMQHELGSFASSPIVTTTASVTRNADSLSYPASNYDTTKGTALARVSSIWGTSGSISKGVVGQANGRFIYRSAPGASTAFHMYDGTNYANSSSSTSYQNNPLRIATSWDAVGQSAAYNNTAVLTGSFDGTMGTGNFYVGSYGSGGSEWFGSISGVKIWKYKVTDSFLKRITQ